MNRSHRRGFTLLEAVVSLLLSSVIVMMITSVFLVQNEFYTDVINRSSMHENVRSALSRVTAELRGVPAGGIVVAEADSVVYRLPIVIGGVCAVNGIETYLHLPLEGHTIDGLEVVGYSVQDDAGIWSHNTSLTWKKLNGASGSIPAGICAAAGADTVGATADFYRLDGMIGTPPIQAGDVVMIFRELRLKLGVSSLDGASTAVFWGPAEGTITEFSNHLSPGSAFQYRISSSSTFQDRVSGGDLSDIVAIRFSARGKAPASRTQRDSLTFNLTASVPLGNAY